MNGIIISDNNILLDAITGNLPEKITFSRLPSSRELVHSALSTNVADLMIIDSYIKLEPFTHKVKTIINLSLKQVSKDEVYLGKPFKLLTLLEMLQKYNKDEKIFCLIDNEWVYDEDLGSITALDKKIKLTDKENETIKALTTKQGLSMTRQELLEEVWKYHPETDSNTIDTHLYRLKQKLPAGMLEINEGCYTLQSHPTQK